MAERTFTFNVNVFTEIMMHASAPDLSPAYSANKHTISQISNALLQLCHCRRVENEPNIKLKHHLIEPGVCEALRGTYYICTAMETEDHNSLAKSRSKRLLGREKGNCGAEIKHTAPSMDPASSSWTSSCAQTSHPARIPTGSPCNQHLQSRERKVRCC